MTVLWCGREELDFKGVVKVSTYSSDFDPNYARCAIDLGANGTKLISAQFTDTGINSFWFGARYYVGGHLGFSPSQIVDFGNSTNRQIQLWLDDPVQGDAKLELWVGGILVDYTDPDFLSINQNYKFDVQIIDYNQESIGTVNVYWDNVLILTYTGTLYSESVPSLTHFYLSRVNSTSALAYMSEIVIADIDTRNFRLKTLAPNAAGDTNDWLVGTYEDIDEAAKTVHDYIKTETADQLFTANLSDLPSGLWNIHAVRIAAATSPAYNGLGLKVGIKTNDNLHLGDVVQATWYDTIDKIYTVNPETTQAFTKAEVNALQIAIESEEVV